MELREHSSARRRLRRAGPILIAVGLGLSLIGMVDFLSGFGIVQPVRLAWCCGTGMPLLLLGIIICEFVLRSGRQ